MKYYTLIEEEDGNKIKTKEIYTEDGVHISTSIKIYDINEEIIEEITTYYFEDLDSVSSSININHISKIKTIIEYYKSGYIREQKIYIDSFVTTVTYDTQGLIIEEETKSFS